MLDTADYLRSENVKVKAGDILNIEWNDINIAGNENRYKIMLIPDDVSNILVVYDVINTPPAVGFNLLYVIVPNS